MMFARTLSILAAVCGLALVATSSDAAVITPAGSDVTGTTQWQTAGYGDGADTHVGVEHQIAFIRRGENNSSYHVLRELARMNRLLFVVVLHVPKQPDVPGVLPVGIA